MKPPQMSPPRLHGRASPFAGRSGESEGGGLEGLSVTWKGWTNGGGERSSTAAQFLKPGDSTPAMHGPAFGAPATSGARFVPAPAAAAAAPRAFPSDPAALLAPIGTAIERLVLNGRDHLSLTVRFGEGGTLSLKLALRGGEIATQIQTDVPGLESALRSAWQQFAQDWQGRGLKLGNPEFSNETAPNGHDLAHGRNGHGSNRGSADEDSQSPAAWRPAFPAPTRRSAPAGSPATATIPMPASDRRGLKTWA